jgi:iron complex outermembrane receptor protein
MPLPQLAIKPGLARWSALGLLMVVVSGQVLAQGQIGLSPSAPSADPTISLKPVEVIGVATDDSEQRRQSTAAKIIVGREDIERYGDSTVGELLKRLPGITMQGRPGRGGAPRMRGLGGGYTQILVDGERVPRGFSLDDLAPDQIERIEILRAPTAETGARAIAGTINIITRGGYRKRLNNVNVGVGMENGHTNPGASWSRNDTLGQLNYNFSVSAMHSERSNDVATSTLTENLGNGSVIEQSEVTRSTGLREGIHANGRLQWRTDGGDSVTLTPMFVSSHSSGTSSSQLTQSDGRSPYDSSSGSSDNHFSTLRLAGVWIHSLVDGASLRLSANLGQSDWDNQSLRQNVGGAQALTNVISNQSEQHDRSLNTVAKYSRLLADQHNLVAGVELESNRRNELASSLQNGESPLTEFDGNLSATSLRLAAYAQDEWAVTPNWAAHAGLRWEGIDTRGAGAIGSPDVSNRSSVATPLLHAVWRPDLTVKDQIRWSLTRSYRSPDLQNMIGRPNLNSMFPGRGANDPIHPDSAGNPALKPELASGLDMAYEHYIPGGGLISANLFYRQIKDLMRSQTTLETVSWADVPRWVARQQNVGDAVTQGLELEAKFRLSEVWPQAPKIDLRANASLFHSRVQGVPGPDNRLDQQPNGTLNLGGEYRLQGVPVTLGGNLNWTPGFTTQLSDIQSVVQSDKRVVDVYGVWAISPVYQLRVSANNAAPREYLTGGTLVSVNSQGQSIRETTQTHAPSFVNLQVKLEMKL